MNNIQHLLSGPSPSSLQLTLSFLPSSLFSLLPVSFISTYISSIFFLLSPSYRSHLYLWHKEICMAPQRKIESADRTLSTVWAWSTAKYARTIYLSAIQMCVWGVDWFRSMSVQKIDKKRLISRSRQWYALLLSLSTSWIATTIITSTSASISTSTLTQISITVYHFISIDLLYFYFSVEEIISISLFFLTLKLILSSTLILTLTHLFCSKAIQP